MYHDCQPEQHHRVLVADSLARVPQPQRIGDTLWLALTVEIRHLKKIAMTCFSREKEIFAELKYVGIANGALDLNGS